MPEIIVQCQLLSDDWLELEAVALKVLAKGSIVAGKIYLPGSYLHLFFGLLCFRFRFRFGFRLLSPSFLSSLNRKVLL